MKEKGNFLVSCWVILLVSFLTAGCSQRFYGTVHPRGEHAEESLSLTKKTVPFTENQLTLLNRALALANAAIKDTLFEKILLEQARDSVYEWDYGRLDQVDRRYHQNPVDFFLSAYRTRGLPTVSQFVGRDDYNRGSVTGSTTPCSETIHFNVENLDHRPPVYVAGTIVHERLHSFCFKHRSNDVSKEYNRCDFAYHAGHLAIVLALYRQNNSQPIKKPSINMCKALVTKLREKRIFR